MHLILWQGNPRAQMFQNVETLKRCSVARQPLRAFLRLGSTARISKSRSGLLIQDSRDSLIFQVPAGGRISVSCPISGRGRVWALSVGSGTRTDRVGMQGWLRDLHHPENLDSSTEYVLVVRSTASQIVTTFSTLPCTCNEPAGDTLRYLHVRSGKYYTS